MLRLGGFHGLVGYIMLESRLEEVLKTVYVSVEHILSGKAISRAIRAHILVDKALEGLFLLDLMLESSQTKGTDKNSTELSADDATYFEQLFSDVLEDSNFLDMCLEDPIL